jgi:hypothetical protein
MLYFFYCVLSNVQVKIIGSHVMWELISQGETPIKHMTRSKHIFLPPSYSLKICVEVRGMPWASQAYGLNHSWINLDLLWLLFLLK